MKLLKNNNKIIHLHIYRCKSKVEDSLRIHDDEFKFNMYKFIKIFIDSIYKHSDSLDERKCLCFRQFSLTIKQH